MRQPAYGTIAEERRAERPPAPLACLLGTLVATQGETRGGALAMAAGAIERYLEVMAEDGLPIRPVERGRAAVTA